MVHSPSCFLFLAFVFAAVTNLSTTTTALEFQRVTDEERFKECNREFTCESTGSQLRFKYPFWGGGGGEMSHCGLPEFKLTCGENYAVIEIMKEKYAILEIKWDEQIVTVVRMDMLEDGCPDRTFISTTVHNKNFEYAPYNEKLTYLYSCSSSNVSSHQVPQGEGFTCPPNEMVPGFYRTDAPHQTNQIHCNNSIDIPVLPKYYQYLQSKKMAAKDVVKKGFDLRYKFDTKEACSECLRSGGQCGCNEVSKELVCFYKGNRGSWKWKLGVGIASLSAGLLVLVVCLMRRCSANKYIFFWRKPNLAQLNVEAFLKIHGPLPTRRYSYSGIKKMTNSFTNKIGQGGYGSVYKGKLQNGCPVAVKVLNQSKGNGEEFINEVATISRTSHVNIVALLGFCVEGSKRALIYEFMCKGSLEKFIFKENHYLKENHQLEWGTLYLISLGIARGLEYLHRGCNTRILHFDVKPHNILLDEDFLPKISDFGLAKVCTREDSIVSMLEARGTIGYIAPEVFCRSFGGVSHKSDVYSYGMMVLEMVGGRKNVNVGADHTSEIYYPHWIYKRLELDDELGFKGIRNQEENAKVMKMVTMGLWCIQTDPSNRPTMSKVIEMLEGSVDSLQVPPKPFLSSPSRSPTDSSTSLVHAWSHGSNVANTKLQE